MKRNIILIGLSFLLLLMPKMVDAASANVRVSSSSSVAVVGSTITVNVTVSSASAMGSWEFLVSYNSNYLQLTSGSAKVADYTTSASGTKSKTYTYKFKALRSGKATVSVGSYLVYAYDESVMSVNATGASIQIKTQQEIEASYSKDNNLKALEVEGYELSEAFSSDVTEYSVSVPSTVDKVKINATKNDSTATISGDGEHEVIEGSNIFEIKVTAQNGNEKVYKVTVNVEDKNPITVKVGNDSYTVIKNLKNITKPDLYDETTIKIDGIEVPAYTNAITNFVLVVLKDESGNSHFAIYNEKDKTYQLYVEIKSSASVLFIKEPTTDLEGYKKTKITIDNVSFTAFKVSEESKFAIVYAVNVETGVADFYVYDMKENTFQRYNDEMVQLLKEENKKYQYVIFGFAGFSILLLFIVIILAFRKPNKKLRLKLALLEQQMGPSKETIKEEISTENDEFESLDDKKTKKKEKKQKKSKKEKNVKTLDVTEEKKLEDDIQEMSKTEALKKVDDVTKMIEDYEKTVSLKKADLERAKKQQEEKSLENEEEEETMYDIFESSKKKKKRK